MRILWITSKFPPEMGGVQRYIFQYAKNMECTPSIVLCNISKNPSYKNIDKLMVSRCHRVIRRPIFPSDMGVLSFYKCSLYLVRFCSYIIATLKKEQIDTIIFGHLSFFYLYAIWLLKLLINVPVVVTFHGEDIPTINMKSNFILRLLLKRVDVYMCNSMFTKRRLDVFLKYRKKYIISYPGVEERFFTNNIKKHNPYKIAGKKILYTVGRLDIRKGHDLVISALPEIIEKYPDIVYLIVGTGPNYDKLKMTVTNYKLNKYVKFLGFIPDEDLPNVYSAGDIFVMPNRMLANGDTEGFGIVFLEAAASGKPIICGNTGGAVEAVDNGLNGFVINPNEKQELINKIIYLFEHREKMIAMGNVGKTRAFNNFRWKILAAKLQGEIHCIN